MTAPVGMLNRAQRGPPQTDASSTRHLPDEPGRYQFHVVAANIADAVLSIGGLIYDRAAAGWAVTVMVEGVGDVDDRPLRVLGAHATNRPSGDGLPRAHLLAVATDVLIKSDALRRHVLELGETTEVLLWGRHHPTNLSRSCVAVRHQPSAAAQVFKAQALIALGRQSISHADEGLYSMA